jgi:hypothetical protein
MSFNRRTVFFIVAVAALRICSARLYAQEPSADANLRRLPMVINELKEGEAVVVFDVSVTESGAAAHAKISQIGLAKGDVIQSGVVLAEPYSVQGPSCRVCPIRMDAKGATYFAVYSAGPIRALAAIWMGRKILLTSGVVVEAASRKVTFLGTFSFDADNGTLVWNSQSEQEAWIKKSLTTVPSATFASLRSRAPITLERFAKDSKSLMTVLAATDGKIYSLYDPRPIEEVIASLKDTNKTFRNNAVVEIRNRGDARALEPLFGLINDPDTDVRLRVIEAFEAIGDKRALVPLRTMNEKDPEASVRDRARKALDRLGG